MHEKREGKGQGQREKMKDRRVRCEVGLRERERGEKGDWSERERWEFSV